MPTHCIWVWADVSVAPLQGYAWLGLPSFLPVPDVETMRWAGRHLPEDALVFCSQESGCLIPALAGRPVYVGHPSETPFAKARKEEAERFFADTRSTAEERLAFLEERNIRYVYLGLVERWLGATDLTGSPRFRLVHRNDYAAVYEVLPAATAERPGSVELSQR
jgi:hypothetical protein